MHRVVGHWDTQQKTLQCYSVREVCGEEERYVRHTVEVCDKSMREFVSTLRKA